MYRFNEEHLLVRDAISDFVAKRIESNVNERVNSGTYPQDILNELGSLGYKALKIPEKYGGSEIDTVSSMIVISEIAKSDASIAHMIGCRNFTYNYPLLFFATEEQKEKYLLPCIKNEKNGVFAVNEPDGFGIGQIKTAAKKDGEHYILNGTKAMITDASIGDYALVFAKTDDNPVGFHGYSFFIVELKNNPGVIIGKEDETMGLQSLKIADIHFDNVKLHKSSLLGTEGKGINVMMKSMEIMRISNSAVALGIAERAFEEAVAYSKLRQVNSVPMYKLSTVQFELAEMKAKLELMRLAVFYTSELLDNNTPGILNYVNTCKLKTTEYAKEICDRALQIFGGYGYVRGYTVERLYRDVRILSIIGGTSESLKWSIFNSIIG